MERRSFCEVVSFGLPSRVARLAPRFAPETTSKVDTAFTKALDWAIDNAWDDAVARAAATTGSDVGARVKNLGASVGKELAAVGAATGGVAAIPTVGTAGSLTAAAAEFGWFTKRAAEAGKSAAGTSAMSLPTSVLGRINGSLGRKAATPANYWAARRLARQADKFFRKL